MNNTMMQRWDKKLHCYYLVNFGEQNKTLSQSLSYNYIYEHNPTLCTCSFSESQGVEIS